jgi:peptidoglycan/LPS O-acetylase OafA/YrhL
MSTSVIVDDRPGGLGRIPSLDGIRTLSFLLVFVAHAGAGDRIPGGFGVTVFFFLSGFLITSLLRQEFAQTGTISLKGFYVRRMARIFPPMYTVLGLSVLLSLTGLVLNHVALRPVLMQALYLTNYQTIFFGSDRLHTANGTEVLWSLAVEEHFYLCFPVFFLVLARLSQRGRALTLVSLAAIVLGWRCALVFHFHAPADRTYLATDTRIDNILWGCVLAVWANPVLDRPLQLGRRSERLVCSVCVALLLVTFVWRNPSFRETFRYSIQGMALLPLFHFAVRNAAERPFRWLNAHLFALVGRRLTYTLYLVHFIAINMVKYRLPRLNIWLGGALSLSMCVAVALLMYYLVEQPCLDRVKKLRRQTTH